MPRWLLAAEADRIQDFVFRSSRLVEAVGGSALLARFCEQVPRTLMRHHLGRDPDAADIVIAAGGAFRLAFDDPQVARAVGRDLAEAYHRATEATLSTADPRPYGANGGDPSFHDASRSAEEDLRAQKADRRGEATALAHVPYVAFCASCGVQLAAEFARRHADERDRYLCCSCLERAAERDRDAAAAPRDGFLSRFFDTLRSAGLDFGAAPGREVLPTDADVVSRFDPTRGYVAYLLADGNNSGVLFDACRDPAAMHLLSDELDKAMWGALAAATALTSRLTASAAAKRNGPVVPVIPLIAAGDDLYTLLPAPYAVDFARRVCLEFESRLGAAADALGLWGGRTRPTMSAAVVVCKKNYPYALAHRHGEVLLAQAKALGRAASLQDGLALSTVSFSVVLGGEVAAEEAAGRRGRQYLVPTARPYSVSAGGGSPDTAKYAVDAFELLDARWRLRKLPGKRRAELRRLFDVDLPAEDGNPEAAFGALGREWAPRFQKLVTRAMSGVRRRRTDEDGLRGVVRRLGGDEPLGWRGFDGRTASGRWSGLPDLLELWDFALDLGRDPKDYEETA
jgi:hypothetical protein